jgi:hypothetical protein
MYIAVTCTQIFHVISGTATLTLWSSGGETEAAYRLLPW